MEKKEVKGGLGGTNNSLMALTLKLRTPYPLSPRAPQHPRPPAAIIARHGGAGRRVSPILRASSGEAFYRSVSRMSREVILRAKAI